jgi:hypothetical protein
MTWRFVVYEILNSLKQQYDDAEITLTQVSYWCSVVANRLLSQHIVKRDSGAFITTYYNIQVLTDSNKYKYFELPENIFDLDKDDGVEFLSYSSTTTDCLPLFTAVQFTRTSQAASPRLYWTDEEKPTPSNPYFYRTLKRIYLLGIEDIAAPKLEGGFYQTIPAYAIDLDTDFPFPDELLAIMQRSVLDLGRFILSLPSDNINDGASQEGNQKIPSTKLISVNDNPSTQTQQ